MNTCMVCIQCGLGHLCGLSPVWTPKWTFRSVDPLNAFSHKWHSNGFSPVWILLCTVRLPASVNRFPQTEHSNGFSPEWIRLCLVNECQPWHLFPHSLHLYLLLWRYICCFKHLWAEKHFLHSVHKYVLSLCVSLCLFSAHSVANSLSQSVRTRGLELLSHAGSVVYASFFVSCEISPSKSTLEVSTNIKCSLDYQAAVTNTWFIYKCRVFIRLLSSGKS